MIKVFLLVGLLLITLSSHADDLARTISVFGECQKKIKTDRGAITVTVSHTSKNIQQATNQTNEKYNIFKSTVEKLTLPDQQLETVNYNVFEKKEWENKKYVSKGFTAEAGLKISTSDISKIGKIIETANKLKIKRISSLQTYVSQILRKKEYENCLAKATSNALDKAKKMATTLNAKVGKVTKINEGIRREGAMPPPPRDFMMAKSVGRESALPPQISERQVDFNVKVEVQFELK